jgi:2,3-diketo-5-methylthio-1-phosphopentane phosphatase
MTARVIVDFDGTLAPGEPTDAMLARFAGPEWREIEQRLQRSEISGPECLKAQVQLMRADPDDLLAFLNTQEIDPAFAGFVAFCQSANIVVSVASDGLDIVIATLLAKAGLVLETTANRLLYLGDHRWTVTFPNRRNDCGGDVGACKCTHALGTAMLTILIGDGRSDFCVAQRADLVLAKGKLATHCRELCLPHIAISGFQDASDALRLILSTAQSTAAALGPV